MIKSKKILLGFAAILAVLIIPLVLGFRRQVAYVDDPASPLIPSLLTDSDFIDELILYRLLIFDEVLYQQTTIESGTEPRTFRESATRTFLGNLGWDKIGVYHTIECLDGDFPEFVGVDYEQEIDIKFDISMYGDQQDSVCFFADQNLLSCWVKVRYSKTLSTLRVTGPLSMSTEKMKLFIEKLSIRVDKRLITSNVCN